ncbi:MULTISPECIES: heat-shock protein HtpX [unclassified Streptomyces]|uniref:arsenate-mycothiol transferase ArsC n=1 Tax=unclassified Streptomyces TaxID=2593676 RepID=UPI000DC7786C|nr:MULTISPECIES: heat-shock protein HtpX [unclassified Streptomyces]AWZ05827.1 heat-shock protein HtpX [Streptomyces sp. ICC4]AWZ13524.1 heat-shock protein HtpX [Streptomyces sp. ICC1]
MSDTEPQPSVLFVCAHNAGRSQIAAAFFEELAGDGVTVRSAGPAPGGRVNPLVVQAMAEVGIDLSERTPRQLTEDTAQSSAVVVTTSGADAVSVAAGQRHEDWPVEDVAGKNLDEVRAIRDDIRARVERLAADLRPTPDPAGK